MIEHGQAPMKDWSLEIPSLYDNIKHHERILFEDMDPFIEDATLSVAGPAISPQSDRSRGGSTG